ncbi:MAG: universal stress protein [Terrimesophilobacter sp.]
MDEKGRSSKAAIDSEVQPDKATAEAEPHSRIVVGIDGSEASINALRYAVRVATAWGVPLEAICVWAYPPFFATDPPANWWPEEEAEKTLADVSHTVFGDTAPSWFRATVNRGTPARVLLDASESAEMLVLGSRGHGGFVGLLLGSVSTTCSQHARCPVLIVPPRESVL